MATDMAQTGRGSALPRRRGGGAARGASRGSEADAAALERGAARRSARAAAEAMAKDDQPGRIHPIIFIMLLALFLPPALSLQFGTITLSPFKVLMLLITFPVMFRFFTTCRFTWLDGMFLAYVAYTIMCILLNRGFRAIEGVGLFFFETAIVYMAVRVCLRSIADIRKLMMLLIGIITVLGLLAIPEAFLQTRFLHEIPAKLTGYPVNQQNDLRWGMYRAMSVFSHQILFGVAAASLLTYAFVFSHTLTGRIRRMGGVGIATFFSLSSAAFIAYAMQLMFIAAERLTRWLPRRGLVLLLAFTTVWIALSFASNRGPARLMIDYLTFNPWNGHYRLLIWENTLDDIFRSPIFGMKPEEWTRPAWMTFSIDNHWVLVAMRGGIPSFLFLMIFMIGCSIKVARMRLPSEIEAEAAKAGAAETDAEAEAEAEAPTARGRAPKREIPQRTATLPQLDIRNAYILTMLALFVGGATVAYFGHMFPLYILHMAIGPVLLAAAQPETDTSRRAPGSTTPTTSTTSKNSPARA